MRAPSLVRLEQAAEYLIARSMVADGVKYRPGDTISGDAARAWPTFRTLLSVGWLVPLEEEPVTDESAPEAAPEHSPRLTRRARRAASIS